MVKSTYENGKHSSKVVEKLGTEAELRKRLGGKDPYEWAQAYVDEMTRKEKERSREIMIKYSPAKQIPKGEQRSFNGGYLFLQRIYHALGLDKVCNAISNRHKFEYDLNSILSRLIYSRIIYPSSKRATNELSKRFIEQPGFELHHIYRALGAIAAETDYIQSELYKRSLGLSKRGTGVLYYDCTNYFFEIEQEDGLKQYTANAKDHKPNPVVQMGLFLDGDGIPLAFNISGGATNEQITLRPLEEKIIRDFELAKFVVCTDAGLSSNANRLFNSVGGRAFVTTQPVKKLKDYLKGWTLFSEGWMLPGSDQAYDINNLYKQEGEEGRMDQEEYMDKVFYKERWIDMEGLEQRLIVTFSLKYRNYQRKIRTRQVARAAKLIEKKPGELKKPRQNDFRRFIAKKSLGADGKEAKKTLLSIDEELIAGEEVYDGFYAVCTNLTDDVSEIVKINRRRWEIEESFRIMKHEFKARPVYLQKDDRVAAHFTTCFLALVVFRYLEKLLGEKYTCENIVTTLREMNLLKVKGEGYIPTYTRTDLTDDLHMIFDFRTDYEIVTDKQMKQACKRAKQI
jgi:hypothetical protein